MLKEEKHTLWMMTAFMVGIALPLRLFGPAVTAIALVVGIVLGLLATKGASLRSTVQSVLRSRFSQLVAILFAALTLSTVFSIGVDYSLSHLAQLAGTALVGLLLYVVLREMPTRHVEYAWTVLCVTTLVVAALALADGFLNDQRFSTALHGRKWANVHRLNFMSSVLCVLLPFCWAWLIQRTREHVVLAMWGALPLALLSFLTVFVSGGRAGWVAVTAAAVVFLYVAAQRHYLIMHRRHWLMAALLTVMAPVSYGLARGFDMLKDRMGVNEYLGADSGRLEIWAFAWEHMFDQPFTGIGIQAFRLLPIPPEGLPSNAHPHNFVIQLLLETGVIGFVASAALIFFVFRAFWRYAQVNLYGLAGLSALVAFFTASLVNTSIFQPWWLAFGIFTALFAARMGYSPSVPSRQKK